MATGITRAALALALLAAGCGGSSATSAEAGAPRPDAAVDRTTPTDGPRDRPDAASDVPGDAPDGDRPDAIVCCPLDPMPTSCGHLGGSSTSLGCLSACDFWCSTNWRVESDEHGCPLWTYDIRKPLPGENALCFPDFDARVDAEASAD